ncbi:MAG: hypothetical protein K2F65_01960, partial [Eubacterium sp.]|nr:hypothetical protein [Eubacterium sp.]
VPVDFVEGDWFRVKSIIINYGNNKQYSCTLKTLLTSGYFTKQGDQYVFDFNLFVKEHIDDFNVYDSVYNSKTDDVYVKEYISSFVLTFAAVDDSDPLDGGEFLNVKRQSLSGTNTATVATAEPTFTYDGVYVDRTKEDIENNAWTMKSRPTHIYYPQTTVDYPYYYSPGYSRYNYGDPYKAHLENGFTDTRYDGVYHDAYVNSISVNCTTPDFDADPYKVLSSYKYRDYYYLRNLVSTMNVDLTRITEFEDDTLTFAYDKDNTPAAENLKDKNGNGLLSVDRSHLLPDDYIEYQVSIAADPNALMPLYHPDVRLIAPVGQRIVGWYILSNDSDISNDDITATAKTSTTAASGVELVKDKFYSLENNGSEDVETNYKQIDISLGDINKSIADNQIKQGKKAVIVLVTQLTNEMSNFEGQTVYPSLYVYGRPQHTFSQYQIRHLVDGALTGEASNTQISTSNAYYSDTSEGATYYRYLELKKNDNNPYYFGDYENEYTYVDNIRSNQTFYKNPQNLSMSNSYVDPDYRYDGMPMTITMTGYRNSKAAAIVNDTYHSFETATFTASFLTTYNGKLYKDFDLTKKPEFSYPDVMTDASDKITTDRFCYFVDENGNVIGTDVGIYDPNAVTEVWVETDKVKIGDELTAEEKANGMYLLKDAVKVSWTFEDVPAGSPSNQVVFATVDEPFVLQGNGRYRDIRTDVQMQKNPASDIFDFRIDGNFSFVHGHSETISNTEGNETEDKEFNEDIEFTGTGYTTNRIYRERPIVTLHTQIFETEEKAAAQYKENAEQIKGYRPGNTVWYKTTVINNKQIPEHAQGRLLDPVIFDKIPEYITTSGLDKNKIKVVWYDREGNPKDEIPNYTITRTQVVEAPDFGGDIVTKKKDNDGINTSPFATGHAFADIKLNETSGNTESTKINYNVY